MTTSARRKRDWPLSNVLERNAETECWLASTWEGWWDGGCCGENVVYMSTAGWGMVGRMWYIQCTCLCAGWRMVVAVGRMYKHVHLLGEGDTGGRF